MRNVYLTQGIEDLRTVEDLRNVRMSLRIQWACGYFDWLNTIDFERRGGLATRTPAAVAGQIYR